MGLALRHSIATAASGARAPMLASRPILPYLLKDRKVRCCCCRLPRALTTTLVRLAVPLVATLLVAAYLFHSQWRSDEPSPSHHSARLNSTIQRSVDSSVGDAGSIDALSLEEHAAVMERQWDGRSHVADDAAVAPLGALQHVVIVTAGLQGAVLGGGIGTAYSALARRLRCRRTYRPSTLRPLPFTALSLSHQSHRADRFLPVIRPRRPSCW